MTRRFHYQQREKFWDERNWFECFLFWKTFYKIDYAEVDHDDPAYETAEYEEVLVTGGKAPFTVYFNDEFS